MDNQSRVTPLWVDSTSDATLNTCASDAGGDLFFWLDPKEPKHQGCTAFTKNQNYWPKTKELAALKQLLFFAALRIDFLRKSTEAIQQDG